MAAVTLAVQMENEYLGFDFAEEMVAEARVGDIVTLTYDFGSGPQRIVGTYEGRETRDSGETFVWVTEKDQGHTRYAIPMGMVEGLRVEARAEHLPTVAHSGVTLATPKARHDLPHHLRSREGRVCARLDYEGMVS